MTIVNAKTKKERNSESARIRKGCLSPKTKVVNLQFPGKMGEK